jgi:hypothetical protein
VGVRACGGTCAGARGEPRERRARLRSQLVSELEWIGSRALHEQTFPGSAFSRPNYASEARARRRPRARRTRPPRGAGACCRPQLGSSPLSASLSRAALDRMPHPPPPLLPAAPRVQRRRPRRRGRTARLGRAPDTQPAGADERGAARRGRRGAGAAGAVLRRRGCADCALIPLGFAWVCAEPTASTEPRAFGGSYGMSLYVGSRAKDKSQGRATSSLGELAAPPVLACMP